MWRIDTHEEVKTVTVFPIGEEEKHNKFHLFCKCEPNVISIVENGWVVLVHNAFDGREAFEQIEQLLKGVS